MKIDLEVVRSIIRLKVKNYENTPSTSDVISILLKITFRKKFKTTSYRQLENNGNSEKESLRTKYLTDFNDFFTVTAKHHEVVPVKISSKSKYIIKSKHGF